MTEKPARKRHSRRRRVLVVIAAALAVWLLVDKVITTVAPAPTTGHWRSEDGYREYLAAYEAAMATMDPPTRTHDVRTDHGTVRVHEWAGEDGTEDLPPVVLVPGLGSGTPMWAENLAPWLGERTIYAMDAVGDAGLSTHAVPFDSFDDHGHWVEQTLAGLDLDRVHLVGHSFGGAIAATHARLHPDRVASLTLLEPVMVMATLPASIYLWSAVILLPMPRSWQDVALAKIGGVSVDEVRERTPISAMVDAGTRHYAAVQLTPRTFTDEQWQAMPMPVRVEIASDSSLAGGDAAAERARSFGFDVVVRPQTTHSLPMQAAEDLGKELPAYWLSHDG